MLIYVFEIITDMAEQAPTMFVEVELECKKCKHVDRVEIPVACDISTTVTGGALACGVVGEARQYLSQCKECGSKEFKIKKQKIKISGAGG